MASVRSALTLSLAISAALIVALVAQRSTGAGALCLGSYFPGFNCHKAYVVGTLDGVVCGTTCRVDGLLNPNPPLDVASPVGVRSPGSKIEYSPFRMG